MTAVSNAANPYADLGLSLQKPEAKKQQLGQEEFLRLMTTQMQNQDPFKPMENGEFLGQIAQFSTVSGIQEMQASFASLAASLSSAQTLQAAQLVGHSVLVPSTAGVLGSSGSLEGAADLPSGGRLLVDVVDGSGQVVRQLDLGTRAAGRQSFAWDGRDGSGERLPEGAYGLRARLIQGNSEQALQTYAVAPVSSVSLSASGVTLELSGLGQARLDEVVQIL